MTAPIMTAASRLERLFGALSIYEAATLKSQLVPFLNVEGDISLDLSAVSEVDAAGVQLLLTLVNDFNATGRSLHLAAPSEAVSEVFALLRLDALLCTHPNPEELKHAQ